MKFIQIFVISLFIKIFISSQALALENKVLFKINNEIITSIDILHEIQYLNLLNENLKNLEKEKMFDIALNSISKEKIKLIELLKIYGNLNVEEKYFNILLKELMGKFNLDSKKNFQKFTNSKGIDFERIEQKIKIELLWNQLIVNKFSKDIKINKDKIRSDISENTLQKEYLLSEIIFNLDNETLEQKYNKIKKEILSNGFENAALIYSISGTANNGGKLGWIKQNSLNKKIKNTINNTSVNNFTDPIVVPGGFLILKINKEKETSVEIDVDKEVEIISREIANKQLNQFSNIYFSKVKKEVVISEF